MTKKLILGICIAIFVSLFTLLTYNAGRECVQCEIEKGYPWYGWWEIRHCTYDFDFCNINITELLKSLLYSTIFTLTPWAIWALRKRQFTMNWKRCILLLATLCMLSYWFYTEVWKVSNSVWYRNCDFADGPSWWVAFESLYYISWAICGLTVVFMLSALICRGFNFITRKH